MKSRDDIFVYIGIIVIIFILEIFGVLPISIGIPASIIILVMYIVYLVITRNKETGESKTKGSN